MDSWSLAIRQSLSRVRSESVSVFFFHQQSSLTFSNMVWITNPDVGEQRRLIVGKKMSEEDDVHACGREGKES